MLNKGRLALGFIMLFTATGAALADQLKPNVVFMLSDNLGYGDLGSYGGGIIRGAPTPNIDALAQQGIRFTNFNVEPECTPSRSALMTGRYAVRSGTTRAVPVPGLPQGMAPWEYTMAEMFKDAGYQTAMLGKWHIGASKGRMPTDQGFDSWWGFPNSTDVARFPTTIGFEQSKLPSAFYLLQGTAEEGVRPAGKYTLEQRPFIDETIQNKAKDYLNAQKEQKNPFFLFLSWSLVHHPSMPHPDFAGRSGNGNYADALIEHDYRVGQVLEALKEAGLDENTIVVYASDNGPDRSEFPIIGDTGPYRGYLGTAHEGSVRTPMMLRWPNKVPTAKQSNEIVAIHDFLPTFASLISAKLPKDRAIDGVDQSKLLLGESEKSARDSVLFFHDQTLMAVKWNQFKVYLHGESAERTDHGYHDLWAPEVFNLIQDPKEANNLINRGYLWLLAPVAESVLRFKQSVQKHGTIKSGHNKRSKANIRIPFLDGIETEE